MSKIWPKNGSKNDRFRVEIWSIFGSIFGPHFLRISGHFAPSSGGFPAKTRSKFDPKMGRKMTILGQKVGLNLGHFLTLVFEGLQGDLPLFQAGPSPKHGQNLAQKWAEKWPFFRSYFWPLFEVNFWWPFWHHLLPTRRAVKESLWGASSKHGQNLTQKWVEKWSFWYQAWTRVLLKSFSIPGSDPVGMKMVFSPFQYQAAPRETPKNGVFTVGTIRSEAHLITNTLKSFFHLGSTDFGLVTEWCRFWSFSNIRPRPGGRANLLNFTGYADRVSIAKYWL